MHETTLAKQILDVCLSRAHEQGAARILAVYGWVAETETLSTDSLGLHFAAHARGTLAEGAKLALEVTHVDARCRHCQRVYPPEHHLLLCPGCGSTEAELLGQTGVGLTRLEVE